MSEWVRHAGSYARCRRQSLICTVTARSEWSVTHQRCKCPDAHRNCNLSRNAAIGHAHRSHEHYSILLFFLNITLSNKSEFFYNSQNSPANKADTSNYTHIAQQIPNLTSYSHVPFTPTEPHIPIQTNSCHSAPVALHVAGAGGIEPEAAQYAEQPEFEPRLPVQCVTPPVSGLHPLSGSVARIAKSVTDVSWNVDEYISKQKAIEASEALFPHVIFVYVIYLNWKVNNVNNSCYLTSYEYI